MKKSISARRVPRVVGQEEDEPSAATTPAVGDGSDATIQRPTFKPRKSAPKVKTSFAPSAEEEDGADDGASVVAPRRSALSRVAIQRNASKRSALRATALPTRQAEEEEDRPSYSAASLQALKASTPSTPRDLDMSITDGIQDVEQGTQALDLTSKFGSSLARYQQPSAIPSAAEIAEKKERRARAAKEQQAEEYISLDPDDPSLDNDDEDGDPNVTRDEQGRLILKPVDKYDMAESRLVRDDEDIMEGFEDFTEDGKVHLGRKAELAATRKKKVDMAAQIAQAEREAAESGDSDASDQERTAAYEAAQTRHGTYGATFNTTSTDPYAHLRPKTPPKISSLPTLDGVLERLRKQVSEMQSTRARKLQEMEALGREKVRLAEEEVRIQRALRETSEKFRALREERGIIVGGSGDAAGGSVNVKAPAGLLEGAGKEIKDGGDGANINMQVGSEDKELDVDEEEEAADATSTGLGSAGMRAQDDWIGVPSAAPGLGMGMGRPPADEDDW